MAQHRDPHPDDLMTTSEAARVLDLSPDAVRWLEREGRLPAQRTTNGYRLFRRRDVEQYAAIRAARKGATSAAASSARAAAGKGTLARGEGAPSDRDSEPG